MRSDHMQPQEKQLCSCLIWFLGHEARPETMYFTCGHHERGTMGIISFEDNTSRAVRRLIERHCVTIWMYKNRMVCAYGFCGLSS